MDTTGRLLGRLNALADEARLRLLAVLERHELSVSEVRAVVQLPQSTVSRHLKSLAEKGWVVSRSEGPSRYYRLSPGLDRPARRLWQAVREGVNGTASALQDQERAREVVARRRTRSEEFFATAAGQWDALRQELYGERADALGLLALLAEGWVVGDLGCGTGHLSALVAPYVGRVVGVDRSRSMLAAARRRVDGLSNVELRQGELEALPVADGELDAAVLSLVLHYVPQPSQALAEAARATRRGGRVVVVDMAAHGRAEYREQMGHVWPGFEAEQMENWMSEAGLSGFRWVPLPMDARARGPLLFAASATCIT
jgi:ubiquinone/menaquinone biosynthesis C-methylase UbiE/DNA-binding transcriptional ArsR family regulator